MIYFSRYIFAKPLAFWRNGTTNVVKYALKQGEYNLTTLEPYTMRYVKVCCFGNCQINDLYLNLLENPLAYKLKFKCQDNKVNRVVEAIKNTLAQNSVDILTDCPSRERAGWLCDSYFTSFSISTISFTVIAPGTALYTCLPALSASITICPCLKRCVKTATLFISSETKASSKLSIISTPNLLENSSALSRFSSQT